MRRAFRMKNELEVHAWQWYPHTPEMEGGVCRDDCHIAAHVHTPNGLQVLREGDWIVQSGELCFVVADESFRIMFSPIEDEEEKN
jgi:hypothetical protein